MANYTIMSSIRTSTLVKSFSPDSPKVVIPSCFAEFLVSLGGVGIISLLISCSLCERRSDVKFAMV